LKVFARLAKSASTSVCYTTHTRHIINLSCQRRTTSIVYNGCRLAFSPAKFANISCAHNYVALQKCCLPTGAHNTQIHTHTHTHTHSIRLAFVVAATSVSGTHWWRIRHVVRTRSRDFGWCCNNATTPRRLMHIFLVIKITLKPG